MIVCNKCDSGSNLLHTMKYNGHSDLNDKFNCSCGNQLSYKDAIINDFCTDHFASEYNFISDIFEYGSIDITVGQSKTVDLKEEIPIINKILLSPNPTGVYVRPYLINDRKSFKIVSSEINDNLEFWGDSKLKVGSTTNINWMLYGRSKDIQLESWRLLLIQAKELLINNNYLLSYLSSAIAFESFVNSAISKHLKEKKLDNVSIDIFLKESFFVDKIFKILTSMFNIKIRCKKDVLSRTKIEKIFQARNSIAHGKLINIDKTTSINAFRTVIYGILDIDEQINSA